MMTQQEKLREALRYLGVRDPGEEDLCRMQQAWQLAEKAAQLRWRWQCCTLQHTDAGEQLCEPGLVLPGRSAQKMLQGCHHAVLLCATIGIPFDSLVRQWQKRDMAMAVLLDACGSVMAEDACDRAEGEIGAHFPALYMTDRFSPGYGDLPLQVQPAMLQALNAGRTLGVTLTESLLMNPAKTVTAVIGLSDEKQMARIRGCAYCSLNQTCSIRKRGEHCGT